MERIHVGGGKKRLCDRHLGDGGLAAALGAEATDPLALAGVARDECARVVAAECSYVCPGMD